MKRIISLVLVILMLFSVGVQAANNTNTMGTIHPQNDRCYIKSYYDSFKGEPYETVWIPLRSALESIGAEVGWNGETKKIYIKYNGMEYVATLDVSDIVGFIDICKKKYEDYSIMDLSLQLSTWGGGGVYEISDDSTYVDDCAMIRLFYYLGYYISIDKENQTFEVMPINEQTDSIYRPLYEDFLAQDIDTEIECLTLQLWSCKEYHSDYNIFNIISCDSTRLDNDDLEISFEFTYNNKDLEKELKDNSIWEIVNDVKLSTQFEGEVVYKRVANDNLYYDYYVIKCKDSYVGYCIVPSKYLM